MFRKKLLHALTVTLIVAVFCLAGRDENTSAQSQSDYTYEVKPTGYVCGTTPPTADIVQAQFVPDDANYNIEVRVQKCNGSAFSQNGNAYIVVDTMPNYSYDVSPTGYVCGTTGQSPNIVEMRLVPDDSDHNIEVRIRKCAGGSFGQGGEVYLDVNGSQQWGPISYSAGVSAITFDIDPFMEKEVHGSNTYMARVYSDDQPTIAKDTGAINAWEVYVPYQWGPIPYSAGVTIFSFDIDPVARSIIGTHKYRVDIYPTGQNYPIMAGTIEAWENVPHTIEWAGGYTAPFMRKPFDENPSVTARLDHGNPQHVDDSTKQADQALYATIDHANGDRLYYSYTNSDQECGSPIGNVRSYNDPFGSCRSYDAHSGHDYGMSSGSDVIAVADGTYTQDGTEGRVLHDLNQDGQVDYISIYRHLSSHVAANNASVQRGEVIAKSGSAGTGAHLHFSVVRVVDGQWYTTDPYGWWDDSTDDPLMNWSYDDGTANGGTESQWLWIDECPFSTSGTGTFCDVPEANTFFSYIEQMATRGVTNGCSRYDPDGPGGQAEIRFFCPDHLLRRDHAMAFLGRAISGIDEPSEPWSNPYPDVQSSSSFYNWIMYFTDVGVVQGYSDGYFHPDWYVTRGQWAKMIVESLEYRGLVCEYTDEAQFQSELQDMQPGSAFYNHVWCLWGWMRHYRPDITIGYSDHYFRPDQEITRAQSSKWSMLGVELIPYVQQEASEGQNNNYLDTILNFFFGWLPLSNTIDSLHELNIDNSANKVALVVPGDDQDWIKLDVQTTNILQLATSHNGFNADIRLDIYDSTGVNLIASQAGLARNGGTVLAWTPAVTGTYYLKVTNTFKYAREGTDFELVAFPIVAKIYLPVILCNH